MDGVSSTSRRMEFVTTPGRPSGARLAPAPYLRLGGAAFGLNGVFCRRCPRG